jgi:hypothetical protein
MNLSRQQVRAELRAQAFKEVNAKYAPEPRRARRRIARAWAQAAWRHGGIPRSLRALGMTILALAGGAASSAPRNILTAATAVVAGIVSSALWPAEAQAQGSRKDDLVINARGLPVGGATVRVCTANATGQPCSPLALIYSDAALTQALVNPTATDGLGNYSFYAAPGRYLIEISGPAITTKQIPNVILPNDPSAPTFTTLTTTSGISAFTLTLSGNLTVGGNASVTGNLALTNQAAAPGTPAAGSVSLYTKSADKKLYYKDDVGAETGPIVPGASTSTDNTFTNNNRFKGPIPHRDITAYGATSSTSGPTTGSITSGTAALTLAAALDFKNGQGIAVIGAGPTSALAAPVGQTGSIAAPGTPGVSRSGGFVTVTTTAPHNLTNGVGVVIAGVTDNSFNGTFVAVYPITSTTFTYVQSGATATSGNGTFNSFFAITRGATGSTTYNYKIVAVDSGGGYSPASAQVSVTTGAAALTEDNYVWITWTSLANADYYLVYRNNACVGYAFSFGYKDNGDNFTCPVFAPATPPASAGPQTLSTTITAGGGTTSLTLAANASNTATSQNVYHDESSFINAALIDLGTDCTGFSSFSKGCSYVLVPAGNYYVSRIKFPSSSSALKLLLRGSLHLTTHPIILGDTATPAALDGDAGSNNAGPGGTFPTVPINVPANVGAGVVIKGVGGGQSVRHIGLAQLTNHGIVLAAVPTAGANDILLEDVSCVMKDPGGIGNCLLVDGDTIFLYLRRFAFTAATTSAGRYTIKFSAVSVSGSSIDVNISEGELNYHTIRVENATAGTITFQHVVLERMQTESNYDRALIEWDGGSGTNAVSGTDIKLDRIDIADSITARKGIFYLPRGQVVGTGVPSGVSVFHVSDTPMTIGLPTPDTYAATGVFTWNPSSGSGPDQGNSLTAGYMRFDAHSLQLGVPLYVGGTNKGTGEPFIATFIPRPHVDSLTDAGAGSLGAGTYYYTATALDAAGGETAASNELNITVAASHAVQLNYDEDGGTGTYASSFRIYRGTSSGVYTTYYTTTNAATFTDTGAAGTGGSPPAATTAYGNKLAHLNNETSWLLAGANGNPNMKLGIGGVPTEKLHVVGATNNFRVDGNFQVKGGSPWVDAKTYGCVGDGVADDTTCLVNALAAAATSSTGKLFIPPTANSYKITSTIRLPSSVTIEGIGQNNSGSTGLATILCAIDNGTPCFDSDPTNYLSGFRMENLQIVTQLSPGVYAAPPAQPALSTAGGGSLAAGTYIVAVTYKNAGGETFISPENSIAVAANGTITVTSPSTPVYANQYRAYVTAVGGASGTETLQATTNLGTNTTISSIVAGAAIPVENTAGTDAFRLYAVVNNSAFRNIYIQFVRGNAMHFAKNTSTDASSLFNVQIDQVFVVSCGGSGFYIKDYGTALFNMPNVNSCVGKSGSNITGGLGGAFYFRAGSGNQNQVTINSLAYEGSGASWASYNGVYIDSTGGAGQSVLLNGPLLVGQIGISTDALAGNTGGFTVINATGYGFTNWINDGNWNFVPMGNGNNVFPVNGFTFLNGVSTSNLSIYGTFARQTWVNTSSPVDQRAFLLKSGTTFDIRSIKDDLTDLGGILSLDHTNLQTGVKWLKASLATALVTGDFALSAGWGSTAAVSAVTGTDQGWQITVTANGTGIAANPTVTLTFHDGTKTNAPICVSKMAGGTGTITPLAEAPTATTNVLTFNGTPVAASTYILSSVCMGR